MAEEISQVLQLQQKYTEFYFLPVDKHCVLLESQQGKRFSYSMLALAKVFARLPEFQDYTVYVVCTPETETERKDFLRFIGAPKAQTVLYATEEYNRLLATAGVLINENSFQHHFVKKEEQIYIRVWNGVPMKAGGRYSESDYVGIGNAQRNLWCADYLVCPNEFTMQQLAENYMLSNLATNKVLYAGRFQNEVLFDEKGTQERRKKLGLEDKQVFVYVPILKGEAESAELKRSEELLWDRLQRLNNSLSESQVLVVSAPYRLREEYAYAALEHIRFMPRSCGVIQMLAMADCFVTDGSDLIFDFAATRKKIVLFSHDQEDMEQYYSLHGKLPFPKVSSVEELAAELNTEKNYDDEEFYTKYSQYNKPDTAEQVLRHAVLKEEVTELAESNLPDNGKKNILIYPGPLFKNGITSSILSLLEHLDREAYNYILFFRTEQVRQVAETLKELPEGVSYYGYTNVEAVYGEEKEIFAGWQNEPDYPYEKAKPVLYRRMQREKDRLLSFLRVDAVIHYEGYGRDLLILFELMPCKKIIYLHNNMLLEVEKKGIRPEPLCHAYHTFDTIALVAEWQRPVAEQMVAMDGGTPAEANIVLAKNVIPYEQVVKRSKEELKLDEKTELNVTEEALRKLLSSEKKIFVTIGRFLPEKGHARLISAFEKVHADYPDTGLVILGGYGPLYEETAELASGSTASDAIVIMKYLSNPYALLAACDYFVLSSYYEGLPVVLTEADIVGLPCVSTDIPGPRKWMEQYGGLLTEDSEQGVMDGMYRCLQGQAPKRFTLDYSEYNKEAVAQFEAMLPER